MLLLPNELLLGPRRDDAGVLHADYAGRLASLASLGKTCRRLHELTRPVLYGTLSNVFYQPLSGARRDHQAALVLMVRSLGEDRRLGHFVRNMEMTCDAYDFRESQITDTCAAVLTKYDHRFIPRLLAEFDLDWWMHPARDFTSPDFLLLALMLSLCPNLAGLTLFADSFMLFPYALGSSRPNISRPLRKLKTLLLTSNSDGAHFDLAHAQPLLDLAPNLTTLDVCMCTEVSRFCALPPHLRSLSLNRCVLSVDHLFTILDQCPSLEHFELSESSRFVMLNDFHQAHPDQVIKALRPCASTLKTLNLDLWHALSVKWADDMGTIDPAVELIESMDGFTALENLALSNAAIRRDEGDSLMTLLAGCSRLRGLDFLEIDDLDQVFHDFEDLLIRSAGSGVVPTPGRLGLRLHNASRHYPPPPMSETEENSLRPPTGAEHMELITNRLDEWEKALKERVRLEDVPGRLFNVS